MAIFSVPNHVLHSDGGFAPDYQNTGTPSGVFICDCAMLSRAFCPAYIIPLGASSDLVLYDCSLMLLNISEGEIGNLVLDVYLICLNPVGLDCDLLSLKKNNFNTLFWPQVTVLHDSFNSSALSRRVNLTPCKRYQLHCKR